MELMAQGPYLDTVVIVGTAGDDRLERRHDLAEGRILLRSQQKHDDTDGLC